ncbi:hypothetical protein O9K51_03839 [Purpureocillium lavendulum]|uniref:Uncharacterized protein n=1 Tax=Purpureocillium lavendulum TaxID=1247861 RepID=A0AB34FU73_9HYPO|nr:hypothetical protein O9K51_03839 [Purpureocillium lavendulum]
MNIVLTLLALISGVVTPLGLSDQVRPLYNRTVRFGYVPDLSGFGNATMYRPDMPLSRDCHIETAFCPGAAVPGSVYHQGIYNTSANDSLTATTRIPENVTAIFTSATKNSSVASILDIQYRSWVPFVNKYFDNHQPYPKGQFRHIDLLLSRDGILALEGIIADMGPGGIGFRNHTAPLGLPHSAEWDEDLLWLEPDIQCADTNLSLELTIGDKESRYERIKSIYLVDDGGVANLRKGNPFDSWPTPDYFSPDVGARADLAAWASNFLTALALNVTDVRSARNGIKSDIGRRFNMTSPTRQGIYEWDSLGVVTDYLTGHWLGVSEAYAMNGTHLEKVYGNATRLDPPEDHPYEYASALFKDFPFKCSGLRHEDQNNTDYNMECGYFSSAPSRVDGGNKNIMEAGSKWKVRMYTCVGANKASIKTASFKMNGTATLDSMTIQSVRDKSYATESDYPLWAFEDWWHPGSEGAIRGPLWGIVDNAYAGTPGYNFSRAPHLYLPFARGTSGWDASDGLDILAGVSVADDILTGVLENIFQPVSDFDDKLPRYAGSDNLILRKRWDTMSQTAPGAANILRLVWTDIMASAVVGTKQSQSSSADSTWPVTMYGRVISYDIRYAIPAMLLLGVWAILLVGSFIMAAIDRRLPWHLKTLLNDTSVGRVAVAGVRPDSRILLRESTSRWLDELGHFQLALGEAFDKDSDADKPPAQDVRLRRNSLAASGPLLESHSTAA